MSADGFHIYFLVTTSKIKYLHATMKSLTNCENPSSPHFRKLVQAFR
jgi:hypothetical protein